jgi:membrane protease YdiL (CAAX protease family)
MAALRAMVRAVSRERAALVATSAIVVLFVWGHHGNLELLRRFIPGWCGLDGACVHHYPRPAHGLAWFQELVSFVAGFALLVLVPLALIRYGLRRPFADFGLGLPPPGRRREAAVVTVVLLAASIPSMVFAARDAAMRGVYPFCPQFSSPLDFASYEVAYLLFFVAIEFMFRGYLLFGLAERDGEGRAGTLGASSVHVSALTYTVWHHGKPLMESGGTLLWGVVTGALVLRMRSIWPVVLVHWTMNVVLDLLIWNGT